MKTSRKSRHPYAWNPGYGWQLLRRNKSYQDAVDRFVKQAEKKRDKKSLEIFKYLSKLQHSIRSGIPGRKSRLKKNQVARRREKPRIVNRTKLLSNLSASKISLSDLGTKAYSNQKYNLKMSTNTEHFESFYSQFGDVIRYPINYKYDNL